GGTGNLKPMMSVMADSGLFVKGLVNETAARQWSMRFTATRGVSYFMEMKDRGDAGDVTGGTGTYSISLQPLPDEEENRSAPLDDSFKGALSGTIGADDDEDSFVFRPKRSGFLAMTSAAFVEGKASPGFRVENGGATMLVENNRVAVVAGKEYSIVVTAADRSFGTDAVGDYSVGFAGENLSVLPEIGRAIPKPSPNDLATEIDDSAEQATEPVATLIEEKESDVADDKPTTLEYPVFGARVIVTIGATTRDPLVDLILSSRFGQTLVATSGVDRILPIGTPTAVPFIPEPMARIYRPVVSVAVTIADRLAEDSRKAYAVASSRLNREYSRWFASARYPVAALIPTEPAESGIQAPGNLMPLESASEASSPTRPMLEWAVPLIGSLFLKNWLPIRKTGRNPGLNRWSSNQIKACR
ncbi:MAG: hypothetical protein ACKO26_00290, partial [Planctomycetota bacterium]